MPTWFAVVLASAALLATIEVLRRMRRASRLRLRDELARVATQFSELADELDAKGSSPRVPELAETFNALIEFLGGNSLLYGVKNDLLLALGEAGEPSTRFTVRQAQARKLALEVARLITEGTALRAETEKFRQVAGLLKGASEALG
jgi:hypothetical protein